MFELDVVYEWHRKPSEFGLCDPEFDLTLMAAYIVAKRKMEAWEIKQKQKDIARERRNSQTDRHYKRHR